MNSEFALRMSRPEPDRWLSGLLALQVHLALAVLLFFGVNWQTQKSESVEVQLYSAVPAPSQAQRREPPSEPLPPPPPPTPQPVVKAEIKPEPIAPRTPPDIVRKDEEKTKTKPKPIVTPPLQPDKPAPTPPAAWAKELQMAEQSVNRHMATAAADRELQHLKATQAALARTKGEAAWGDRIRAAIRNHIVVPPGISGNPEALYEVSILPDGTVLATKLQKSSGYPVLDAAIDRAIRKASPLPKPEDPAVFTRELKLTLRPLQDRQD